MPSTSLDLYYDYSSKLDYCLMMFERGSNIAFEQTVIMLELLIRIMQDDREAPLRAGITENQWTEISDKITTLMDILKVRNDEQARVERIGQTLSQILRVSAHTSKVP